MVTALRPRVTRAGLYSWMLANNVFVTILQVSRFVNSSKIHLIAASRELQKSDCENTRLCPFPSRFGTRHPKAEKQGGVQVQLFCAIG